ncbi:MAG: hypothetical protein JW808_06765 [Victivallales bacterium]|nr:hypothetical protein [Victivallales bacterium]
MVFDDKCSMDEFYWEGEFRKDDSRVRACMKEIPSVIDLPGEDELLVSRVEMCPEHVRDGKENFQDFTEDYFDWDEPWLPDNWKEFDGAEVYSAIELMTQKWSRIYAFCSGPQGLAVLCHYGNIMGLAVDLVDFGPEKDAGLKIALCKRILKGINDIIACFKEQEFKENPKIPQHEAELLQTRQAVADLRFKFENDRRCEKEA